MNAVASASAAGVSGMPARRTMQIGTLTPLRQRQDINAHDVTVREFLLPLLRDVLGYTDIASGATVNASGHTYDIRMTSVTPHAVVACR